MAMTWVALATCPHVGYKHVRKCSWERSNPEGIVATAYTAALAICDSELSFHARAGRGRGLGNGL